MKTKRNDLISLAGISTEIYNDPQYVYLHIPFCISKCPYCAFYSRPVSDSDVVLYLEALEKELAWWSSFFPGGKIRAMSLYIGGGTPSILSIPQWQRLIHLLGTYMILLPGCEVSVEANPGSLSRDHILLWKELGLTRISLGVQSLSDEELKWLGRPHDAEDALRAMALIREHDVDLSADLLFGLAGQDIRQWHRSLKNVLSFNPAHISVYQLMLEEGTPWGVKPPDGVFNGYYHYRFAQWYLARKGMDQYEVASFSKPGKWCHHNIAYWYHKNVIGLGPSAWGYINNVRYCNFKDLYEYSRTAGTTRGAVKHSTRLNDSDRLREAVILATRTRWGFIPANLSRTFDRSALQSILDEIKELPENLFVQDGSRVALSNRGLRVGNSVWERII
jgi:oxygen-independent coproporphyrinogen-3 oxidase